MELSDDIVAQFFVADHRTQTQTSSTVTSEPLKVRKGRYYQLGKTPDNPHGVRGISAVTMHNGAIAAVEGTDYTVDMTRNGQMLCMEI
ncbi:protein of unknown function (plasmid) [Candidatus Methylocalor cossyra]|uniref:Uncharacterized protein n=1 Tax=Candidatus Methylocalor cossyra TaxID=3108543 RepID=A0ABP1CCP5_9GAMM